MVKPDNHATMNEIIQIKCPWCSATLSVLRQKDMESKNVTCPACGQKSPFVKFKATQAATDNDDGCTKYPPKNNATDQTATELPKINLRIGRLNIQNTGISYQLKTGRNIVGRKALSSSADFQIPTGDNNTMSREHLIIEVKNIPGKGFVHYVSLFKERLNKTFVDNEQITYGDCVILNNGDSLRLPGATLLFELPDNDATTI